MLQAHPKGFKKGGDGTRYIFESEVRMPGEYRQDGESIYGRALKLEQDRVFELASMEPRDQLERIKEEVEVRVKITKNEIFKIGELLTMAKRICQQEDQGFKEWITDNFDFSYETANNFMNVFKNCLGMRDVAMRIKPSILYKIGAPNFPDELRDYLFEQGQLDEMSNGRLRKITKKFKQGGFEAIEEDVVELNRGHLIYRQTAYTFDQVKHCLRTLEHLQTKIDKGEQSGLKGFFEINITGDEKEAFEINTLLWDAVEKAIGELRSASKKSQDILERYKESVHKRWGMLDSDGRLEKREQEKREKEWEKEDAEWEKQKKKAA